MFWLVINDGTNVKFFDYLKDDIYSLTRRLTKNLIFTNGFS